MNSKEKTKEEAKEFKESKSIQKEAKNKKYNYCKKKNIVKVKKLIGALAHDIRNDWNDNVFGRIKIMIELSQKIHATDIENELNSIIEKWDGDGRIFRDNFSIYDDCVLEEDLDDYLITNYKQHFKDWKESVNRNIFMDLFSLFFKNGSQ